MYISTGGGLGKDIEKSGHVRKAWSECQAEGTRQRRCDIEFKVKYRSSFEDFRREVERAFARWMTLPRAHSFIKKLEAKLKQWHQEISDLNYPANAPMQVLGAMVYRGPSGTWRVVDVVLQAYMLFSSTQLKAGAK
jgi:hypothetical protein